MKLFFHPLLHPDKIFLRGSLAANFFCLSFGKLKSEIQIIISRLTDIQDDETRRDVINHYFTFVGTKDPRGGGCW